MLFENEWIDPRSDCQYVSRDQVTRCEDPDLDCSPQSDLEYVASVDYGPVKDRTVVSLSTKRGDQVQIVQMRVWQGSKDRHVSIEEVESYLDQLLLTYPVRLLIFDKYQMEASIQKYQRRVDVEVFEPRGPSGNHAMAECLRNLIVNGKIKWRPETGSLAVVDRMGRMKNQTFSDELVEVAVKLQPGGYRVTNLLPGTHDDRFCAAAMGILHTIRRAERCPIHINDLWF
jgi:hypothetical protein